MKKRFATKRQHYVPRFLLRRFSTDGRSISMFVLKNGCRVEGASIVGQCYGDYFYGDDGGMEKAFADEEAKVASIIRDTTPAALETLTKHHLDDLRKFVHWQRARTQGAADHLNKQTDAVAKGLMRQKLARDPHPKFTPEDFDKVVVKLTNPQAHALYAASQSLPLIFDLAVKFVLAPDRAEFLVSDHPVATCNQFVENDEHLSQRLGWTGLSAKGLQFFLPISPKVTLAVYDPCTYGYGSPKSLVCGASVRDVMLLNRLQAITAVDALYFSRNFSDAFLEMLLDERRKHRPVREADVRFSDPRKRSEHEESQLMVVSGVDIRLNRKFSFVELLEKKSYRDYYGATIPVRNQQLLDLTHGFSKYLKGQVEEARRKREEAKVKPTGS
jgi:hypothetical protein